MADEGIKVAVTTLRRWLAHAGLWQRKRVRKQHRRRRARKEFCGELVQMDGSHHDWFEGRREWAVLMVMIDDATGRICARFFEEETLEAAFTMLQCYVARYPQGTFLMARDKVRPGAVLDRRDRIELPVKPLGRNELRPARQSSPSLS